MADASPRRSLFIRLRSRPNGIEIRWDQIDSSWATGLSAVRDFADHYRSLGPEPRIELPAGHPDQDDYLYDSASEFRYVDLAVLIDNDAVTLHEQYGKDIVGDPGATGPLRPWIEFMDILLGEIEHRS